MPKNNRHGKATILSENDWYRLEREVGNNWFAVFLAIARFTGERWGAICQLRVEDVYENVRSQLSPGNRQ